MSENDISTQPRVQPADSVELMDEPCTYEEWLRCIRDLEQVNWVTRGYHPTLRFLERAAERFDRSRGEPLRVLDVGFGGGGLLRRVAMWAHMHKLPVQLTGVDMNPHAARAAAAFSRDNPRTSAIRWMTGDATTLTDPVDVVLSSLTVHHMNDPEIEEFVGWMERTARVGWSVNDLHRSQFAMQGFTLVAKVMGWHRFVRHDGVVSFKRSFVEGDWRRYLAAASVPIESCNFVYTKLGRLCVERLR